MIARTAVAPSLFIVRSHPRQASEAALSAVDRISLSLPR